MNDSVPHGGIVVGVDGSDGSAEALRWAWREAQTRGLPVTAVMAWDYLDQPHADGRREFDPEFKVSDAEEALDKAVLSALGPAGESVRRRAVCDKPAPALLEASVDAALVVVGARGLGGFEGLLLGSTSQHVLHHSTRPVAVVRHDSATRFEETKRVTIGVDGSEHANAALRWAIDEAHARHATLSVVHAWHMSYAGVYPFVGDAYDADLFARAGKEILDQALAGVQLPPGLSVDRAVAHGSAAQVLLERAATSDLLVVGARGLGGFASMVLGSVGQHLTRHADCPVVVIP